MINKYDRIIFHVDVNSAYLSWTAVKLLQYGSNRDIRDIPSAIAGNIDNRHGIILTSSIPAKEMGVKTGEAIWQAKEKCNQLEIYEPDYDWYMKSSASLVQLLKEYSPKVQRYSIDECFMDCSHFKDNYKEKALEIKNRISSELGFNCNIGISTNKLLAKMASDFKPKNSIHTLFDDEIEEKMWPLPVEDLFMVGRATKEKLKKMNVNTIGELAHINEDILVSKLHSHGKVVHNYANGIENSEVRSSNYLNIKGIGNSITIHYDVEKREDAYRVLLSLTESSAMRLRENNSLCGLVCVSVKTNNFIYYSHQKKLSFATSSTEAIFEGVKSCFDECWKNEKIRQLGVRLTDLKSNEYYQPDIFNYEKSEKQMKLDKSIDEIRKKFGPESIVRSTFINSGIKPLQGGTGSKSEYPMMSSII